MKAETMIQWIETLDLSNSFFNDIKKSPLEFNKFVRLLFVSRWSVMVCRKQNFKGYFKKYGFFFLRLLLRKIITGKYNSNEIDNDITTALKLWITVAGVGKPEFDRSLGALKLRKSKKKTKRKHKRKKKTKRKKTKRKKTKRKKKTKRRKKTKRKRKL